MIRKLSRKFSNGSDLEQRRKELEKREAELARKNAKLHIERVAFEADQRKKLEREKQDERDLHAGLEDRRKLRQNELLPRPNSKPASRFSLMPALAQERHDEGIAFVRRDSPPLPGEKPRRKAARHPTFPERPATANGETATQRPATGNSGALPRRPALTRRGAIVRRPAATDCETTTQRPSAGESRLPASPGRSVVRFPIRNSADCIDRSLPPRPTITRFPTPVHHPIPRRPVFPDVLRDDMRDRQSPMSVARGRHPTRPDSPTPSVALSLHQSESEKESHTSTPRTSLSPRNMK